MSISDADASSKKPKLDADEAQLDGQPPGLTLDDGAAAARRLFRGSGSGGSGGQRSRPNPASKSKASTAAARRTSKTAATGVGGGRARSGGGGGQPRRRPARGGAGGAAAADSSPLPPGSVRIFTDDFLRLNAQREKTARQLRRSVIVREEEALLRTRHTEDLADAVADLLARRDAGNADAEALTAALTDLRTRLLGAFPELSAEATSVVEQDQQLLASVKLLTDKLDPDAVSRVLTEFSSAK